MDIKKRPICVLLGSDQPLIWRRKGCRLRMDGSGLTFERDSQFKAFGARARTVLHLPWAEVADLEVNADQQGGGMMVHHKSLGMSSYHSAKHSTLTVRTTAGHTHMFKVLKDPTKLEGALLTARSWSVS